MTATIRRAYNSSHSPRRGFTLVEISISVSLMLLIALSASGLTIIGGRLYKIIRTQQQALGYAKQAMERINRAIHTASTPVIVNPAPTGNRVTFKRSNDGIAQAFELKSTDDDMKTPWDNELIYDPDTTANGDEIVVARWLVPIDPAGAFTNPGGGHAADCSNAMRRPYRLREKISFHFRPWIAGDRNQPCRFAAQCRRYGKVRKHHVEI